MNDDEQLTSLFKQSATTITQLYTLANKGKQAAKKQGYQIALEELWTFSQSKNSTTISIDDLGNWIRQKYQAIGEEDESNTNNIPIIETQFQNECGKRKWNDVDTPKSIVTAVDSDDLMVKKLRFQRHYRDSEEGDDAL